jgi:predicted P-loop ATPase
MSVPTPALTAEIMKQREEYRIKCVKGLNDAGFCLFPLVPGMKDPAVSGWQELDPGVYHERNLFGNYGVTLRAGDLIIDVDPRNGGEASFEKLVKDLSLPECDTFRVRTGGGGHHIYLSKPADALIRKHHKEYIGIDFLSAGCFVVGPGSIHPDTKAMYEVVSGAPGVVADAPEILLSVLFKDKLDPEDMDNEIKTDNDSTQQLFSIYLKESAPLAIQGAAGDDTTFKVACHGRDLGLPHTVVAALMETEWNTRCQPPWHPADLMAKVANAYQYAAGVQGAKHPSNDFKGLPAPAVTPAEAAQDKKEEEDRDWHLNKTDGRPLKTLHNLLIYLRFPKSPVQHLFGFNDFTLQIEVVKPAPWHNGKMPHHPGIVDRDLTQLKAWLAKRHKFEVPKNIVLEGVEVVAYENRFHPVQKYLEILKWDGTPRLDTWLSDYAGVDNNPYTRACSRKTICAAVARVFRPGCKFDHILVLEGNQDTGKSRLCAALGGEFYGDFILDPHNKDTIQNLQGAWIVEMSEMEVTRRADVSALKAFITRTTDKVRLPYERLSAPFPRQCIFIGTINPEADGAWLKDDTGNRRFWPVAQHGKIDIAGLKAVRNQLFAEAVEVLKKGEKLFMETKGLSDMAKNEAGQRHAEHPWTECIANWASGIDWKARGNFVTVREIYLEALQGTDKTLSRRETVPIATVMKSLGWVKTTKNGGPDRGTIRGYMRPAVPVADAEIGGLMGDL